MPYTEIKLRNNRKYFYRALSVRHKNKIKKERIYLGSNLSKEELAKKEVMADNTFKSEKIERTLKPIKNKIIPILKKYKIKKAGIFGSYVRGEQNNKSDVDILIQPPEKFGLFDLVAVQNLLKKRLRRKVDLLTYAGIYHLLRDKILAEEKKIL